MLRDQAWFRTRFYQDQVHPFKVLVSLYIRNTWGRGGAQHKLKLKHTNWDWEFPVSRSNLPERWLTTDWPQRFGRQKQESEHAVSLGCMETLPQKRLKKAFLSRFSLNCTVPLWRGIYKTQLTPTTLDHPHVSFLLKLNGRARWTVVQTVLGNAVGATYLPSPLAPLKHRGSTVLVHWHLQHRKHWLALAWTINIFQTDARWVKTSFHWKKANMYFPMWKPERLCVIQKCAWISKFRVLTAAKQRAPALKIHITLDVQCWQGQSHAQPCPQRLTRNFPANKEL